jgi:chemotaxis protein CheD
VPALAGTCSIPEDWGSGDALSVTNDSRVITVGIAELKVARFPTNLSVIGLGSCIGVCLFDLAAQIGGIAHVMLPELIYAKGAVNKAKFGDTAIEALLEEVLKAGAALDGIVAKIAGGAHMFHIPASQTSLKLGERNAAAVKLALNKCNIPLIAEDIGGQHGRTIMLDTANGRVLIKTINQGEKII